MSEDMFEVPRSVLDQMTAGQRKLNAMTRAMSEDTAAGQIIRESLWAMARRLDNARPVLAAQIRAEIKQVGLWRVFTNDVDTLVALDLDDLPDVYKDHYGDTMEASGEDMEEWYEITSLDKPMTIWCEEDDYNPEDPHTPDGAEVTRKENDCRVYITATTRAWAKANGRGFLCSTEY